MLVNENLLNRLPAYLPATIAGNYCIRLHFIGQ